MAASFQAFIDESSSSDEFVLAGHIATAEAWVEFAKEWDELLPMGTRAKDGRYHFKMTEMARMERGIERTQIFYNLIEKYVSSSISCRINLDDFAHAQERLHQVAARMQWSVRLGVWENPYFVAFRILLLRFHEDREKFASKIPLDQKVDFIFDERTEKTAILAAWDDTLDMFDETAKSHFGATPRFENDQQFLPLQAADLWAWWVRRWYEEDASDSPDKMLAFDFGSWRGKRRPNISISINEAGAFEFLQSLAVATLAEGEHVTPSFPYA